MFNQFKFCLNFQRNRFKQTYSRVRLICRSKEANFQTNATRTFEGRSVADRRQCIISRYLSQSLRARFPHRIQTKRTECSYPVRTKKRTRGIHFASRDKKKRERERGRWETHMRGGDEEMIYADISYTRDV